ncbi:MAG: peptide chain release factor N(5)-glutamine methyltransferase [Nitrospirae bacterium]|nr:peptide chain release factor N(5)-glutamine methyltransferase [Nitrospirota bacterium]MBI3352271.1 peptide chain release factor N(5)-glutamine methyltransferase [Nitrospirota bacterium]
MGQRGEVKNGMNGNLAAENKLLEDASPPKTFIALVRSGGKYLQSLGIGDNPRLQAERLLGSLLKCRRLDLYLNAGSADPSLVEAFHALLERRGNGEPLQYLTGEQEFLKRSFKVGQGVLIPRQETELLVREALRYLKIGPFIDLGTGSGCIGISLLLESKEAVQGFGLDFSEEAIAYARENAQSLGIVPRSLHFRTGDLFSPLPAQLRNSFEMIVSNPPYLNMHLDKIEPSVRLFEPRVALDGGEGGIKVYERIFSEAGLWLKCGGFLILEIGYNQKAAILNLLKKFPFLKVINVTRDEQDIDRVMTMIYDPV